MQNHSIYSQGSHPSGSLDSQERMDILMHNFIKPIPNTFTPSSIPQQDYNMHNMPVRILQQEQDLMMGGVMGMVTGMDETDGLVYGGLWEDGCVQPQKPLYSGYIPHTMEQMENYLRPSLCLTTDNLENSSEQDYDGFYSQESYFDEQYSFYHGVSSYSNEPSPFMDHRQLNSSPQLPLPSLPRTPVTPALDPFEAPSSTYIMVPTTVQDMDGTMTIKYLPKLVAYDHPASLLDMAYVHNHSLEQPQQEFQFEDTFVSDPRTPNERNTSVCDRSVVTEPEELVGMGLYDDALPDLVHSPEMGPMGLLNSGMGMGMGMGRGLVLEESFDASENGDDEDEEEEEEEDDRN